MKAGAGGDLRGWPWLTGVSLTAQVNQFMGTFQTDMAAQETPSVLHLSFDNSESSPSTHFIDRDPEV